MKTTQFTLPLLKCEYTKKQISDITVRTEGEKIFFINKDGNKFLCIIDETIPNYVFKYNLKDKYESIRFFNYFQLYCSDFALYIGNLEKIILMERKISELLNDHKLSFFLTIIDKEDKFCREITGKNTKLTFGDVTSYLLSSAPY